MPKHYLQRLQSIDQLIRIKGTGTPKEFAKKMRISESTLYIYLSTMRELGAPIVYSKRRGSYYYEYDGGFDLTFKCGEKRSYLVKS
jgi:predicted DNA-binding transcriptional regulator YafY